MAMYCTCAICRQSAAQPNGIVQGPLEQILGAPVQMQPGWTLAHWSGRRFDTMRSIEIHDFVRLEHKLRAGVSFYLYQEDAPAALPAQLRLLGLGGGYRYTIGHTLGNQMSIFYKGNAAANPAEVTVNLGCGGSITFDGDRQALRFNATDHKPILTIT